jgi:hypothetical protein
MLRCGPLVSLAVATLLVASGCRSSAAVEAPAPPAGASSRPSPTAMTPTTHSAGSSVTTGEPTTATGPQATGVAAVGLGQRQFTYLGQIIVYGVAYPAQGTGRARPRRLEGTRAAVVDIKVCANGDVDGDGNSFDPSSFQVQDERDHTYPFLSGDVGARSPNLADSVSGLEPPQQGLCRRGWLTFELPTATSIQSVRYNPLGGGIPLTWRVRQ